MIYLQHILIWLFWNPVSIPCQYFKLNSVSFLGYSSSLHSTFTQNAIYMTFWLMEWSKRGYVDGYNLNSGLKTLCFLWQMKCFPNSIFFSNEISFQIELITNRKKTLENFKVQFNKLSFLKIAFSWYIINNKEQFTIKYFPGKS